MSKTKVVKDEEPSALAVAHGVHCCVEIDSQGDRYVTAVGQWPVNPSKPDICEEFGIQEHEFDERVIRLINVPASVWKVLPSLVEFDSTVAYAVVEPFTVPLRWISPEEYALLMWAFKEVADVGNQTQELRHNLHVSRMALQESEAVLKACERRLSKQYVGLGIERNSEATGINRLIHSIGRVRTSIFFALPKEKK